MNGPRRGILKRIMKSCERERAFLFSKIANFHNNRVTKDLCTFSTQSLRALCKNYPYLNSQPCGEGQFSVLDTNYADFQQKTHQTRIVEYLNRGALL